MDNKDAQHIESLRAYWETHQSFPSMAKLCPVVGMVSTASVFEMVGRLVEAGYLQRNGGRIAPTDQFFARPLHKVGPTGTAPQRLSLAQYSTDGVTKMFLLEAPDMPELRAKMVQPGDVLVMLEGLAPVSGDIFAQCSPLGWKLSVVYDSGPVESHANVFKTGVAFSMMRRFSRDGG